MTGWQVDTSRFRPSGLGAMWASPPTRMDITIHPTPSFVYRGPLHTRPGLRPVHPLQAGEGPSSVTPYGVPPSPQGKAASRRWRFLTFPWGEGAAAAAEEGRYRVGSGSRPTPVRASPCHPLPGEGFSLIRHALRRATFPVGEGILRRVLFLTFPLAFQTFFRLPPLRISYCVVK